MKPPSKGVQARVHRARHLAVRRQRGQRGAQARQFPAQIGQNARKCGGSLGVGGADLRLIAPRATQAVDWAMIQVQDAIWQQGGLGGHGAALAMEG